MVPMENWVLCRIFLKRRGAKNVEDTEAFSISRKVRSSRVVFYDFLAQNRADLNRAPPASSSSATSGITEVSTNESDEHEESSSCNSFPYFRRKQP